MKKIISILISAALLFVPIAGFADDYNDEDAISVRRVVIYSGEDIAEETFEMMVGVSITLTAVIYPEEATDKRIHWKSEDENIATVDENGVVKAVSEGTVKIYAVARDSGRQDSVTVEVTPYIRFPDSISITPQEDAVYETGRTVKFTVTFAPEDTTEREMHWSILGDGANIDQNGTVTISGKGSFNVKAYSQDWKQSAEYLFDAKYSSDHFTQFGEAFNVKNSRAIVLRFDSDVCPCSVVKNIFVAADPTGNQNFIEIQITTDGKQVIVIPTAAWNFGENYIFIKSGLSDKHGVKLGKNLKYKFTVRGEINENS